MKNSPKKHFYYNINGSVKIYEWAFLGNFLQCQTTQMCSLSHYLSVMITLPTTLKQPTRHKVTK